MTENYFEIIQYKIQRFPQLYIAAGNFHYNEYECLEKH